MDREDFRRLADRFQYLMTARWSNEAAAREFAACEADLVRRVREHDEHGRDALWALLIAVLPELTLFLRTRMPDPDDAHELVQQVVDRILTRYERGSPLDLEHGLSSL